VHVVEAIVGLVSKPEGISAYSCTYRLMIRTWGTALTEVFYYHTVQVMILHTPSDTRVSIRHDFERRNRRGRLRNPIAYVSNSNF
jgi:hypothetical protein